METDIGQARNADVPEIAEIWYAGWCEAHLDSVPDALIAARPQESFTARARTRLADTIVARSQHGIAGFVMVLGDEVDQMYVAAEQRSSGVAARLLSAAELRIAGQGHSRAWLAVVPANARARRFYARQGWRDDGWFEHDAPGPDGPVAVACHRYVKDLNLPAMRP